MPPPQDERKCQPENALMTMCATGGTHDPHQAIPVDPDADTADGAAWLRYRNCGRVAVIMVDGHAEIIEKRRGALQERHLDLVVLSGKTSLTP